MLSLLYGVAAYVVTFTLLLFCYRCLKNRRLAKRGSALARDISDTAHPNRIRSFDKTADHLHPTKNHHSVQKGDRRCGISDASQLAQFSLSSPFSISSDANDWTQRRATK